jgi:hypothetical protein
MMLCADVRTWKTAGLNGTPTDRSQTVAFQTLEQQPMIPFVIIPMNNHKVKLLSRKILVKILLPNQRRNELPASH